jgi:hypothetical protein
MHQTCLKCEKTYFKKNIHTQLTTWKKNANIKNLPHPSHHFSNGPSLKYAHRYNKVCTVLYCTVWLCCVVLCCVVVLCCCVVYDILLSKKGNLGWKKPSVLTAMKLSRYSIASLYCWISFSRVLFWRFNRSISLNNENKNNDKNDCFLFFITTTAKTVITH